MNAYLYAQNNRITYTHRQIAEEEKRPETLLPKSFLFQVFNTVGAAEI